MDEGVEHFIHGVQPESKEHCDLSDFPPVIAATNNMAPRAEAGVTSNKTSPIL